jgi:hypothetical protein
MSQIFFVRHQAVGVLWEYPFAQAPTDEQRGALQALCESRHGAFHPKTEEPYWLTVVAVNLLTPQAVIEVPAEPPAEATGAIVGQKVTASATATVQNP